MSHSPTFRTLFLFGLVSSTVGAVIFTTWLFWPRWQDHRAALALVQVIEEKRAPYREQALAAQAIGQIRSQSRWTVPVLIEALKSEDQGVRASAAFALGNIGRDAKAAVPGLLEALDDEQREVRVLAAWALKKIGVDVPTHAEQQSGD